MGMATIWLAHLGAAPPLVAVAVTVLGQGPQLSGGRTSPGYAAAQSSRPEPREEGADGQVHSLLSGVS
jgi:hypothetical protein